MRIHIDGKEIETDGTRTVLETARENGIRIPSLCDHARLTPFTGCRLCLVEVKGRRGFVPSCSLFPEEGMEVVTSNPQLRRLRTRILELILSEHPSACLICSEKSECDEKKATIRKVAETTGCVLCPNNGRCELQEVVEAINPERVRYPFAYRDLDVKNRDPFFEQNYNLCVLCGRCMRVCHEVRGNSVIHFTARGSDTVVGTVMDRTLLEAGCRFCGACVDVCPTGALTEKAVRYESPPDEFRPLLCGLCGSGCSLEAALRDGRWLGVRPAEKGPVNEGQACVKGRFLVRETVESGSRILHPMIRRNKDLVEVGWEEALEFTAERLQSFKGDKIGLVGSCQLSCEDIFALRRLAGDVLKTRRVGVPLDGSPYAGMRELARDLGGLPPLNFRLDDLARADAVVVLAGDLPDSHPMVWLRILEAVRAGAELVVIEAADRAFHRWAGVCIKPEPGREFLLLAGLARLLIGRRRGGGEDFAAFRKSLDSLDPDQVAGIAGVEAESLREAASRLKGKRPFWLVAPEYTRGERGKETLANLWNLARLTGGTLIPLASECNTRGWFELEGREGAGGLAAGRILQDVERGAVKALYLAGPAARPFKTRPDFLVVQDAYWNDAARDADVVLPATVFAEHEGVYVNLEGRAQVSSRVRRPPGEARPDWWIFSRLAFYLGARDFSYRRAADVLRDIRRSVPAFASVSLPGLRRGKEIFLREGKKAARRFVKRRVSEPPGPPTGAGSFRLRLLPHSDSCRALELSESSLPFRVLRDSSRIQISGRDAGRLKVKNGDILEIKTASGRLRGKVKISDVPPPGIVIASPSRTALDLDSMEPVSQVKIKRGKP